MTSAQNPRALRPLRGSPRTTGLWFRGCPFLALHLAAAGRLAASTRFPMVRGMTPPPAGGLVDASRRAGSENHSLTPGSLDRHRLRKFPPARSRTGDILFLWKGESHSPRYRKIPPVHRSLRHDRGGEDRIPRSAMVDHGSVRGRCLGPQSHTTLRGGNRTKIS